MKSINKSSTLLCISALLCSSLALAENSVSGKVTRIYAHKYDRILFQIDKTSSETPACSTSHGGKEWAIKITDDTGRAMMSTLLAAAAQGKTVIVAGDGTCDDWGDRQKPKYVMVKY